MNDRTKAYLDDLVERAAAAQAVPRLAWSQAQPNACHANCEAFVCHFAEYELVRGWLVLGGCWFLPHSVVRETMSSKLIDITPDPSNSGTIPFVDHQGTEDDFAVLRKGRDGGWLYPEPTGMLFGDHGAAGNGSFQHGSHEIGYTDPTQPQSIQII
jgi:hypothetical protein